MGRKSREKKLLKPLAGRPPPTRKSGNLQRLVAHLSQLSQRLTDAKSQWKEANCRIEQLRECLQKEGGRAEQLLAALEPAEASGVSAVVDALHASLDESKAASDRLQRDFSDSEADGSRFSEMVARVKLARSNSRRLALALRTGTVDGEVQTPADQQEKSPIVAAGLDGPGSAPAKQATAPAAAAGGASATADADPAHAADPAAAESAAAEQAGEGHSGNPLTSIQDFVVADDPNLAGIDSWISELMAVPDLDLDHVSRTFALVQSYRGARLMNERLLARVRKLSQQVSLLEELCSGMPQAARSSALLTVAQAGDVHRARVLHSGAADASWTTARDPAGLSPLLVAAAQGHLDLVRFLLEIGANKADKLHTTQQGNRKMATHLAAAAGHQDVAAALIEAGVSAAALDEVRKNVLHYATAQQGSANNCRALIAAIPADRRQACLMSVDQSGRIPLHYATWHAADADAVRALINAYSEAECLAAALNHADSQGWLPLHLSAWHGSTLQSVAALLSAYKEAEALDASLARLNSNNASFLSILTHHSAEAIVVSLLLDALDRSGQLRAALEQVDSNGRSPLHTVTANSAHADAVQEVLQAFEDADLLAPKLMAASKSGRLPLHNVVGDGGCGAGAAQALIQAYERTNTFEDAVKTRDRNGCYPMRA